MQIKIIQFQGTIKNAMFQSGANESSGSRLDLFLKTTVARKLGHIRSAPGARGARHNLPSNLFILCFNLLPPFILHLQARWLLAAAQPPLFVSPLSLLLPLLRRTFHARCPNAPIPMSSPVGGTPINTTSPHGETYRAVGSNGLLNRKGMQRDESGGSATANSPPSFSRLN